MPSRIRAAGCSVSRHGRRNKRHRPARTRGVVIINVVKRFGLQWIAIGILVQYRAATETGSEMSE
jgi:hypothetical protein